MLSEKIRALRRRSGLPQEELADKLNVSRRGKAQTRRVRPKNHISAGERQPCF